MRKTTVNASNGENGQAVVMVTLGLFAMCGMMGMAVDMGWSYYTRKAEVGAADAATLAAVRQAVAAGCPTKGCPSGSPPAIALAYAAANGFSTSDSHVTITGSSGSGAPPWLTHLSSCGAADPPCVLNYVSMTISDSIPQLFSAVIGHPFASVGVRSTSVIAREIVNGSVVALNRATDPSPVIGVGTDFCAGGGSFGFGGEGGSNSCISSQGHHGGEGGEGGGFGGSAHVNVEAPSGIVLSSICGGNCSSGAFAGYLNDGSTVTAPFTQIMGTGKKGWIGGDTGGWSQTPINIAAGQQFSDPFSGAGQPPVQSTVPACPSLLCNVGGSPGSGGALPTSTTGSTNSNNPTVLPPGNYWVKGCSGRRCTPSATGAPVTLGTPGGGGGGEGGGGESGGGSTQYFQFGGSGTSFGTYIFYGGLYIATNAQVTFGPGMYIFVGSNQTWCSASGGAPCPEFTVEYGAQICDGGKFCGDGFGNQFGPQPNDAGEILVFTNTSYPGLSANFSGLPGGLTNLVSTYGTTGIDMAVPMSGGDNGDDDDDGGESGSTGLNLHGLSNTNANVPSNLQPYAPVLMWQDQGNSLITYTSAGKVDTACGSINTPCQNSLTYNTSPEMDLTLGFGFGNNVAANIAGAIYQPRGAWFNLDLQHTPFFTRTIPIQIVTGAMQIQVTGGGGFGSQPSVSLQPTQFISRIATSVVE